MNLKLIKQLCCIPVSELKKVLYNFLHQYGYKNIKKSSNFIIAEGKDPICLIAHMDTVFSSTPTMNSFLYDKNKKILWSPYGSGFDDKTGIYSILTLIHAGVHPSVIFTDGEEVGGIGAHELIAQFPHCPFKDCRAIIELDRANEKDMVFYNCNNENFIEFIEKYNFEFAYGSFTDISIIAPVWGIAAVNLSTGYVDEHTFSERLYCTWCDTTIEKVKKIILDSKEMPAFNYIPISHFNDLKGCLFCGRHLKKNILIKDAIDPSYNYYCCPSCYKKYEIKENI